MRAEYILKLMPSFMTQGKDLFINYMDDSVEKGALILPSLAGGIIDYDLRGWRNGDSIQIVVRHPDVKVAYNLSQQIADAVTIEEPTILKASDAGITGSDIEVQFMRPRADPIVFPRPQTKWWEVSINFNVCYRFVG